MQQTAQRHRSDAWLIKPITDCHQRNRLMTADTGSACSARTQTYEIDWREQMEFAKCTQNGVVYAAQQFAVLPPGDLSDRRRSLACPECGGRAFFRAQTLNDRDACFGAWPHADGCQLSAAQTATNARGHAQTRDHPVQRLVVDFEYGAPEHGERSTQATEAESVLVQNEAVAGSGFSQPLVQHMRLRSLLRMLTSPTPCQTSPPWVDVAGFGTFAVADFFVPFEAATPMHNYQWHGFFGQLISAHFVGPNTLWLNSGGYASPGICIPVQFVAELFSRFGISNNRELAGARVLVFGTMQISQTGKRFVALEDLNHITLDFEKN